jgi:hypothetical protein
MAASLHRYMVFRLASFLYPVLEQSGVSTCREYTAADVEQILRTAFLEVFAKPVLCLENFQVFAAQCARLQWKGPVSLATDCSRIPQRIVFTSSFAPVDLQRTTKVRKGGHLLGSTLPFKMHTWSTNKLSMPYLSSSKPKSSSLSQCGSSRFE